jgi:hypothetical protein
MTIYRVCLVGSMEIFSVVRLDIPQLIVANALTGIAAVVQSLA